jgi:SWIM zinc finger
VPIEVSDSLIRAIATKDKALSDGRTLVKKGAFQKLGRLPDDSLLWGQCQGSGAKPYEISVDLAGDNPTLRCSCPVKPPPCKHILGLLVCFVEQGRSFAAGDPDPGLLEKRAKNAERADKKAEAAARPREVNTAALEKKTTAQRDALDLLETLVVDVASAGLGTLDAPKAQRIADQARQMNDAYLPGAAEALRRLAALCERKGVQGEGFWGTREPGSALPDELRHRLMIRHLTRLWAMIRRGQKTLDGKLDEGGSASDSDAVVEDLLGRIWDLPSLKAAGYWKQGLDLFEVADERYQDAVRQERIEQSWLLDLSDGAIYVDRKFRPLAALDKVGEKASYERPLRIDEAGVYPGFVNRRVRWELKSYHERQAATPEDFERLHRVALPAVDAALARYKEQIKNPLAPDEAVVLVRVADIQHAGPALVAIDEKGGTLVLQDSLLTRYRTTNNLEMAAGANLEGGTLRGPASLLVRLYLGLDDDAIYGQPLALVTGTTFTRLCM